MWYLMYPHVNGTGQPPLGSTAPLWQPSFVLMWLLVLGQNLSVLPSVSLVRAGSHVSHHCGVPVPCQHLEWEHRK